MLADWLIPSLRGLFVERRERLHERRSRKKEAKCQAKGTKSELKAAKMEYAMIKHAYKAKKRQLRNGRKHCNKGFVRMPTTEIPGPEDTLCKRSHGDSKPEDSDKEHDECPPVPPPSYDDVNGDLPSYEMATQPLYPILM